MLDLCKPFSFERFCFIVEVEVFRRRLRDRRALDRLEKSDRIVLGLHLIRSSGTKNETNSVAGRLLSDVTPRRWPFQ